MSANDKLKRQRRGLYKRQNGLCFYCDRPMLLMEIDWNVRPPSNLCTIEHLDDKHDVRRGKGVNGQYRRVAACWQCNMDRSIRRDEAKRMKRMGIEG